ncbi:hydroxymethylglutaryl-CoA lyase [Bordetella pertussis]|uniref:Hydroxymethylglutaryl-CoA lyase n=3 Tax=Bordetella pertussis TaxID=520 RepID=Q7VSS8_BORPE|nr:hydroxymethylglutaryl-CoA lyase [Bordetella pertussis]AEE68957.1 putative hydroxymethylglutaryl-CoA lyase [Bordetella pertussis CS]AIW94045.1 hydroxymethylglutaryl-CoA lyase [Bordetella pertussis B1917]AIW97506.1 hydroxymethylglutaryl-CoA lyase [Bordetella pertussis B1920]AJB28162.1 hydroxymethylglutaryl-CoA lyase [Bordetella pertussis 137]ALH51099.1 hydroxymethylglutaryl-CoA lyase [Bordetella pertussis]
MTVRLEGEMAYPRFVEFHEEGPREGFQSEKTLYPLASRVALVDALTATGLKKIQVASFVNPRMVPAMADAAELFGAIRKKSGVRHTALWLNAKGIEKAAATAGVDLDGKMMLYASEAFSWSNNGCSAKDQQQRQLEWLAIYDRLNLPLEAVYVATAFGCQMQGEVPLQAVLDIVDFVRDLCAEQSRPLPSIFLGDTVGWGNPEEIKRRVNAVRERAPGMRVGLHLHDTRGMGAANFYAALQEGVDLFDSSIGGLGGCPFCNHTNMQAAGNICTEDMVQLCHELGIETGIDLDRLIEASRLAEEIIGRTLSGKVMHSDSLDAQRAALRQAQAGEPA